MVIPVKQFKLSRLVEDMSFVARILGLCREVNSFKSTTITGFISQNQSSEFSFALLWLSVPYWLLAPMNGDGACVGGVAVVTEPFGRSRYNAENMALITFSSPVCSFVTSEEQAPLGLKNHIQSV